MPRRIVDLLSTVHEKGLWNQLIASMRYPKGQEFILAYQLLKNCVNFNKADVDLFIQTLNHPNMTALRYEENVIKRIVEWSGLSYKEFLVRKERCADSHEQLIQDWYAEFCDQAYYDTKKPALLAVFQERMDSGHFFLIARITALLRQKNRDEMTWEERTIFETLYSAEAQSFFNQYLKQDESDTCKNAFGENKSLYAYFPRKPLDVLAGQFFAQSNALFFLALFELQGACKDAVFQDSSFMRQHWDYIRKQIPRLTEEMRQAISPIPPDLLSAEAQQVLGVTSSDLRLPKNFSDDFSADVCMTFFKEIKPFLDRWRNVALKKLGDALIFNDLGIINITIRTLQLELVSIRKHISMNEHDLFSAVKKAYDLVSLELKLAKQALKMYPEVGRLLYGYTLRNIAAVIDYFAHLYLDKEAFFTEFPECETLFFWQCVFNRDPAFHTRLCWGLLQVACDYVTLTQERGMGQSRHYTTEIRLAGLSSGLNFFSMGVGDCYKAEELEDRYRLDLNEAHLKKLKHELPRYQSRCEDTSSYGGGRFPSW